MGNLNAVIIFYEKIERFWFDNEELKIDELMARTYLQLPLRQWGAGNVYLIDENSIAVMGL